MADSLYLHGFASGAKPHSPKVGLLRSLGHRVDCLSTAGHYRVCDYVQAFDRRTQAAGLPDVLVGTSLGGFWAREFGCRHARPWVALNPALHPSRTLARSTGTLQRFDADAHFEWTLQDAEDYRDVEDRWLDQATPGLIVVAADDDVVDPDETRRCSGNSRFVRLPRGGHELANTDDYAATLARFIAGALPDHR